MNSLNEKSVFKKNLSKSEEIQKTNSFSFRKGLTERLSVSFQNKQILERVPGHDMLTFE